VGVQKGAEGEMSHHRITKIISGGQTGADRAGLDVAIEVGLDYGGAIPAGRRTEDGTLSLKYTKMKELKSRHYQARTEKNVLDADAIIIFTFNSMGSGSALTKKIADQHYKPCLHINLSKQQDDDEVIRVVSEWLDAVRPHTLKVAGSRESGAKGIYNKVFNVLKAVLKSE
jgi:Circularly permutated YpsA SLOG family